MADAQPPAGRRQSSSGVTKGLVIQGSLEETPLPETVQILHTLRKTGQLAIERSQPRQAAGISFVDGRVVHAYCPPLIGDSCFRHLLSWRSGRYVFLTNAITHERSIVSETGALLLDAMRHLDELARCLSRLPPRSTVLHRRRDRQVLRDTQLTFAHLRLWRRFDGRTTVGEILDENSDGARLLVELIGAGLAATSPDHRFLHEIVLVQTMRGAGQLDADAGDLAALLLIACDGRRTLADVIDVLSCPPEEAIAAAEYLLARRLVQVARGAEAAELLA